MYSICPVQVFGDGFVSRALLRDIRTDFQSQEQFVPQVVSSCLCEDIELVSKDAMLVINGVS